MADGINIELIPTISPDVNVDLSRSTPTNPAQLSVGNTYVLSVRVSRGARLGPFVFSTSSTDNIVVSEDSSPGPVDEDFTARFAVRVTDTGAGWVSVSVKSDGDGSSHRTIYHFNCINPISLSADVDSDTVIVENGIPPNTSPRLSITFTNTDSIVIVGGPGTRFNSGDPLRVNVENSKVEQTIQRVLPFALFDNLLGPKAIVVSAITTDGRSVSSPVTFEFTTPEEIDSRKIFTNFTVNRQGVYKGQPIQISYIPQNSERMFIDDGRQPRFLKAVVGLVSESGEEFPLDSQEFSIRERSIVIPESIPEGTYRVYVESENRFDDEGDTREVHTSLLTVQPGLPASTLTLDMLVDRLFSGICGNVDIPVNINKIINDKKVLRNVLVTPSFDLDQLIFSYIPDTDGSIVLKLYEPFVGADLDEFIVAHELVDSSTVNLRFERGVVTVGSELRGANFDIDDTSDLGLPLSDVTIVGAGSTDSTPLLRYDELVNFKTGTDHTTISDGDLTGYSYVSSGSMTTDIINSVLSSSNYINDELLDIDYTDFSNFVFYSSAKERFINFKYKLQLIEADELKIRNINDGGAVTGSLLVNREIGSLNANINRLKSSFDGYEKHLYYGTGSTSWPKLNGTIVHTTGSTAITYYTSQSNVAEKYDDSNNNYLKHSLPEHVLRDEANTDFILFVSMLGQHFDLVKTHVDAMQNVYVRTHTSGSGTPAPLIKPVLESLGWQIRTSAQSSELTDYLVGKKLDGTTLNATAKKREERLLRRFLNNIPLLLKTKGTRAAIRAIFNIYGIPESFVQIREFGGPKLLTNKKIYYTFDDPIAELNLSGSEQIEVEWIDSDLGRRPDTVEMSFRTEKLPSFTAPAISGSWTLLSGTKGGATYFNVYLDSEPSSSFNGRLRFTVSGSTGLQQISSSKMPFFDGDSFTFMVARTSGSFTDTYDLYVKKSLYTKITHESSASVSVSGSNWETATEIVIGNEYSGSVDEFRMWKVPLSEDSFDHHVRWHESTRGDNYTSSVSDLLVRLTFDRPQDLATSPYLVNFAYTSSNGYAVPYATASNFTTVATSPYQFTYTEQDSAFEAPTLGYRYETDKIRFESQSFINGEQLDRDRRATKKSFDQSPVDSNRLGIFFSPTTEINRDMIRAFTGHDFMNEIGDPWARYSSSYADLKTINAHYWERNASSMNVYDYITLIRQFDKTVFDYVQDVTPARAKLSKGILIEPHMLERNRVRYHLPEKSNYQYDGFVNAIDTGSVATGEVTSYDSSIEAITGSEQVTGDYYTYTGDINTTASLVTTGEASSYTSSIFAPSSASTQDDFNANAKMVSIGFYENYIVPNHVGPNFASASYNYESFGMPQGVSGIYAIDGVSDIIFLKDGMEDRKRVKLELINVDEYKTVSQLIDGNTDGQEGAYQNVIVTESIQRLNVLNISASFTAGGTKVDGYLPFHRVRQDAIPTGLQNAFYNGCKQTEDTTIDGSSPIEVFISDVTTLKVNKTDRSNDEPILTVE